MFVIFANQKRFFFLLISKKCFDLIYIDVWDHTQYHEFMIINIFLP